MVLVVGATGSLGGLIARMLLSGSRPVRALARPDSAWQPLETAGAEIAIGDLKTPATLARACEGVEALVTTANSALRGGPDNTESVDWEGNRNLIDAARAAGVEQFVFVSAFGVTTDSPVALFRAKARSEAYLRGSGVPFTILAPDGFMDVWIPMIVGPALSGRPVAIVGEGRRRHSWIASSDVAAFAVAALGRADAINQHLPIGGPDAVSWRDVIALFERRLGRDIPIVTVPPGQPLPGGLPAIVADLMAGLETYDSVLQTAALARAFGVRQTSLDEFALAFLRESGDVAGGHER